MQHMNPPTGPIRLIDPALIVSATRARNVVTRSGVRMRGLYASRRFNRMLPWESPLELHAIELCEFYPGVVDVVSQPMQLALPGLPFRYTPDLVVETSKAAIYVIECKPDCRLKGGTAAMLSDIGVALAKANIIFRVLTEQWVDRPNALINVRTVIRHRKPKRPLETARWKLIKQMLPCRFSTAAETTSTVEVLQAMASWLIAFDLDRQLDADTWLSASQSGDLDATPFI